MSYLVLARKYRPRSFAEMVGQSHVVQALGNALTQQRLHHAYLFTGTRGVGKTTVSRILAKSLNCTGADGQGGITATPCGVCPACRDIDAGRFVDYVELDAASNRGVDEIGQLLDQAVYKPVVGRFKVYMIDEVHMLSTTAFNAMLKTLEEPPEYLKFVLATTDPQKVPVTVLSRCLQFNLRPMAAETVAEHLQTVLDAEAIAHEPVALRLLARAARGSMRDALSLTDQAIAYAGGTVGEAAVRQMLGAVDRSHAVRIVQALGAGDGAALVGAVDALRELGLSAAGTLEELADLAQRLAVIQAVPAALDAADPEAATLQALLPLLAADELQLLYSIAIHGRAELALAPDEYAGLVMVLLRMLAFRPGSPAAAVAGERPVARSAAPVPAPVAAPAPAVVSDRATAGTAAAPAAAPAGAEAGGSRALLRGPQVTSARVAAPPVGPPSVAPVAAPAAPAMSARPPAVAPVRAAPLQPAASAASAPSSGPAPWDDEPPWVRDEREPPPVDQDAAPARPPEPAVAQAAAAPQRPPARETPSPAEAPLPAEVPVVLSATPTAAAAPAAAAAPIELPRSPLQDRWMEVFQALLERSAVTGLVRELGWQAECVGIEAQADGGQVWTLRLERESLRQPSHRDRLQAALSQLLEAPQRIEVEAGVVLDSAARRDAAARERRQREAERTIHDDPQVQQLLARYPSARIVPGSIVPR